jgi:hypothetical protein
MKHWTCWISLWICVLGLTGCATQNAERLGRHMNLVKTEQIYNPNATTENLALIPAGNGERLERSYNSYTGKEGTEKALKGSVSQVLGDMLTTE